MFWCYMYLKLLSRMNVHLAKHILGNYSAMAGPIDLKFSGDILCFHDS